MLSSRTIKTIYRTQAAGCICERSVKTVVCRSCGSTTAGRVSRVCSVHPKMMFLMDLRACPKCRSSYVLLVEHDDIPVATTMGPICDSGKEHILVTFKNDNLGHKVEDGGKD